ncbi:MULTISPECIES: excinuclease ABC subunit UvrC [Brucella/Ochrobactrum group]|uniref:UvrABC system protein C n=1 Tax=Brucella anthropi (strain ATCC 49188 / DSM 6882 / CCUG 24695 / JCM 21032 / LMG 3331 / NBRC 15819 / NCTC 12168 / Alc 37) TaxID=439375 RepID=A6X248_BRUA4|nr:MULTISPECIES: excinuclease ABC subunit UvrC [Brucella/Ochrobactrum group]ABS15302.1 excinuclease ABC, C subunit [Brucella anthropi ATCC 49188]KIU67655.1 excinuclease ABC subunit C [Brucella anthropi]MCQ9147014.1 excinuclease ABC subunit UvrC [Ochrobactrum sp. BTU2]MDH0367019.1 excinuclease ABC subunit UvrC [Brucella anthropi]QPA29181.1 excinuclease ABC subunit UvrC [Brucella anthropi]
MTGNRKNNEDAVANLPSDDEQDVAGIIIGDAETDDDDETDDIVDVPASPSAADSIQWDSSDGLPDIEGLSGQDIINAFVKRLPNNPGVYRMFNSDGDVLYVGKARNLKKRVSNYARGIGHSNRITRMIRETVTMEFVVTRTETEALLLEANLIKRLRPRFNVLMRDDKSFPYILLTGDHRAPGIFKHRGARSRKGDYFGPFASAGAVGRTINALQRAFLLRTCTDSVFETRTRPCLLFQIKRCSGPCTHEISDEDYAELVNEAKAFLSGKSQSVKDHLATAMQAASADLDFEHAAVYRDRLAALSHVQSHQGINPQTVEEADVFAIHQEGGMTCIQVFFFRTGQNWGNRAYFPKADSSLGPAEVLGAFLSQFYDDKPCPRLVLLSETVEEQSLIAEALSTRAGHKVQVNVPQRGEKKDLVDHALTNAREALGRRLAETSSQARLLQGMAETFGLSQPPRRIEVYDNSHIMGTNAVGGMIVAGPEGFVKNQYRKFNIRSTDITPGDDFGMMREVIERRFSRLVKEHGTPEEPADAEVTDTFPAWPDVILIDGGQGQVGAVRQILGELGISHLVNAIGIAKGVDREAGRERFFVEGKQAFTLPPRDPVLYFIQRLRDEAHRFAIGTHRARRKKEMVKNPLDEIAGIGPSRKRALLHHFGTAKAVSRAAVADLMQIEGISEAMAKTIHDHFRDR